MTLWTWNGDRVAKFPYYYTTYYALFCKMVLNWERGVKNVQKKCPHDLWTIPNRPRLLSLVLICTSEERIIFRNIGSLANQNKA